MKLLNKLLDKIFVVWYNKKYNKEIFDGRHKYKN